jgi:uncharacterized membrane protein YhhN
LEKENLRKITKIICIPSLCLFVSSLGLDGYHTIIWQVYAGLLFAWLGDIFLVGREKMVPLVIGTGCFAICHILYSWAIIIQLVTYNTPAIYYVGGGIAFLCAFIIGFLALKKKAGTLTLGSGIYFGLLAGELFLFISLAVVSKLLISILGIVGMILHIASDVFLVYTIFFKTDIKRRHFYIMSTYLVSQTMIILSLIF